MVSSFSQEDMIIDLFKQISRDQPRLSFHEKVDMIHDWVNYYEDGNRVVDVNGNYLPHISHLSIEETIRRDIQETSRTEMAMLHHLQSQGIHNLYPMIL